MSIKPGAVAAVTAMIAGTVLADELGDARNLLCAVLETQICMELDGCEEVLPEDLNMPRFIRIDTGERKLSTTPASGENRETIATTLTRTDGQLVLQGMEAGRAWSLYIDEASGQATFASAAEGRSVTVFATCTPATGE